MDFGPDPIIEPQRIDTNHLLSFINAYLTEAGQAALTDVELFDASRRLAELVTVETGITPLLARLFAEQLADLQKDAKPISDLPRNVPDLMLKYLNLLNRNQAPGNLGNTEVHKAAKIAAWECAKQTFKPGQPGAKGTIREKIATAKLSDDLLGTLEIRLKVVKTIEPAESHIQFLLDPLSEYLAALEVVEERLGDEKCWREFLMDADTKPGSPSSIRGFLAAVRDCCLAHQSLQVPLWVADELAKRIGLDPEIANVSRLRRRKEELIKNLAAIEAADRAYAAKELGKLGLNAEDAVSALIKMLKEDKGSDVRAAAAGALGGIGLGDKNVVSALAMALMDQGAGVSASAYGALGCFGPSVVPILKELLPGDEGLRRAVTWTLRHLKPGP